ncbi:MAG: phospholipid carrier-dependent glycosyltransferase [Acidobacteriota bacterium]
MHKLAETAYTIAVCLAIGLAAWCALAYAHQPLLEAHATRQTQTALTAYWLAENGPSLAYETPVLGKPWSIPFELPIYQMTVALMHQITGTPLDATGRLVSFLFLLACLPHIYQILRALGFRRRAGHIFAILFFTAPQYLFWGRSFLIETAALFFTVAAVRYFAVYQLQGGRNRDLLLFAVTLSCALLQKVTTAAAIFGVLFLYWLYLVRPRLANRRRVACELAAFALSGLLTVGWLHFSDSTKSYNEYGRLLTSDKLRSLTLGTPEHRLSPDLWVKVVHNRQLDNNLGGLIGIGLLLWALAATDRRTALYVATCLFLFLAALLAFPKLHIVHDYYQTSITIWLLLAAAIALAEMIDRPSMGRLGHLLLVGLVLSNLYNFLHGDYTRLTKRLHTKNHRTLIVANQIDLNTPEDSKILVLGLSWSSQIAYYARRKALSLEPWPQTKDEVLTQPEQFLGEPPSAVVFCPDTGRAKSRTMPDADTLEEKLGREAYVRKPVGDCQIFYAVDAVDAA